MAVGLPGAYAPVVRRCDRPQPAPAQIRLLPGWQLAPFYQPAREVGGDFYDLLLLSDGRLVPLVDYLRNEIASLTGSKRHEGDADD